jgi:hypothetical protein
MYMEMGAGDRTNKKENRFILIDRDDLPLKGQRSQTGEGFIVSGGGDHSNLSPADIPDGMFIECEGSTADGWGWAVIKPYGDGPIFSAVEFNDEYQVTKFQFCLGLYLHCNNQFSGGGNVKVKLFSAA